MGLNNFDRVAPFYDLLAKLVFGEAILKSQIAFLGDINDCDRVLVLGGGTGQLLEYIAAQSVIIDYVEPSEKMLSKAKKRNCTGRVVFHQQRFEDFDSEILYDVIICPFFLDLFEEDSLKEVINKIKRFTKPSGKLSISDFQNRTTFFQKWLIRIMHLFFRITVQLESRSLKEIHPCLQKEGFQMQKRIFFYSKFIFSSVYRLKL